MYYISSKPFYVFIVNRFILPNPVLILKPKGSSQQLPSSGHRYVPFCKLIPLSDPIISLEQNLALTPTKKIMSTEDEDIYICRFFIPIFKRVRALRLSLCTEFEGKAVDYITISKFNSEFRQKICQIKLNIHISYPNILSLSLRPVKN